MGLVFDTSQQGMKINLIYQITNYIHVQIYHVTVFQRLLTLTSLGRL